MKNLGQSPTLRDAFAAAPSDVAAAREARAKHVVGLLASVFRATSRVVTRHVAALPRMDSQPAA